MAVGLTEEERRRAEQQRAEMNARARKPNRQMVQEVKAGLHPTYKPFTYTENNNAPNNANRLMIEAEQAPDAQAGSRRFVDFGENNQANREKFFTGRDDVGITRAQAMKRFGRGLDKDAPFTAHLEIGKYNYTMPGSNPLSRPQGRMVAPDRFRGDPADWAAPKTMPQKDTSQVNTKTDPLKPTDRDSRYQLPAYSQQKVGAETVNKQSLSALDAYTQNFPMTPQDRFENNIDPFDVGLSAYGVGKSLEKLPTKTVATNDLGKIKKVTQPKGFNKFMRKGGKFAPLLLLDEAIDRFSTDELAVNVGGAQVNVDANRLDTYSAMLKDLNLGQKTRGKMDYLSGDRLSRGAAVRRKGEAARDAFINYATGGKFDPAEAPQISQFVGLTTAMYEKHNATKFKSKKEKQAGKDRLTANINKLAESFVKQRKKALSDQTASWAKARGKRSAFGKVMEDLGVPFAESGPGYPTDDVLDIPFLQ